jgi:NADPH:quinone reductase-like Zn-dependent oxidoreductase
MLNTRVVVTKYGGPEVLQLIQEEAPQPEKGEVRIKVQTAGVALADVMRREGVYPGTPDTPFTPGYDVAGVIDCVGKSVNHALIGQKVTALMNGTGGYTQYICLPESEAVALPEGVDSAEAVSLALNYVTAYQMLYRLAKVREGDRILIHGGAGGVGTAFLQLGKLAGLKMYATASASKHPVLSRFGAVPIDYRHEDFVECVRRLAPEGVDAVFDPIGGTNWTRSSQTLRKDGIFVGYGFTSILANTQSMDSRSGLLDEWKHLSGSSHTPDGNPAFLYSVTTSKHNEPAAYREDLNHLLKLLAEKQIRPLIAGRYPLDDVLEAHKMMDRSTAVGKIILEC